MAFINLRTLGIINVCEKMLNFPTKVNIQCCTQNGFAANLISFFDLHARHFSNWITRIYYKHAT